jgi:type IV secretion system protein VirD4
MIEQAPHRMQRETLHRRFLRIGIDALVVLLVVLNWIATQLIALALHYPPFFMGRIVGHIYQPFAWWVWQYHWPHAAVRVGQNIIALEKAWTLCDHIVFYPAIALAAGGGLLSGLLLKLGGPADLHGSASWADATTVKATGLLGVGGIYLAIWSRGFGRRLLRDGGKGHLAAIAPTRSGKGTGVVIPTCLTWPGSLVVLDLKGENFRHSAGRRQQLGNVILKFDPTSENTCCFNPFEEVAMSTVDRIGDIDNIATSLLDPRGKGAVMDNHWDRQGVGWLGAVLAHLLYIERDKTLRGLANLIAGFDPSPNGDKGIIATITRMRDTRHTANGPDPDVAREMQMMLDKAPNERSGIISTVQGFLKIYRDPHIAAATSRSDFRIADLMNHEKPLSLYLIVPVRDLDRVQPLVRLVLNQILKGLTPRMEGQQPRRKLLLLLDELCVLGHMELLSKMLPFIAGYGIRAALIFQNLKQIEAAYGRDQSLVETCETLLALTPNRDDFQTGKYLSDLAGDTTVVTRHRSWNSGGTNISEQQTRRALITPGEVLELPTTKALIYKRGAKPILADQFVYFQDQSFDAWSKLDPPAQSDRIYHGVEYVAELTAAPRESVALGGGNPGSLPAYWKDGTDAEH